MAKRNGSVKAGRGDVALSPAASRRVGQAVAQTYFQKYYDAHRPEIAKQRHERYHQDKAYRDGVLRRSAERYARIRAEHLTAAAADPVPPRVRGHNRPDERAVVGGEICVRSGRCKGEDAHAHVPAPREWVTVHSVAEFASRLARNVQTVTMWEQRGVLPPPTLVDEIGRRWYAEAHMNTASALVHQFHADGGRSLSELRKFIRAGL